MAVAAGLAQPHVAADQTDHRAAGAGHRRGRGHQHQQRLGAAVLPDARTTTSCGTSTTMLSPPSTAPTARPAVNLTPGQRVFPHTNNIWSGVQEPGTPLSAPSGQGGGLSYWRLLRRSRSRRSPPASCGPSRTGQAHDGPGSSLARTPGGSSPSLSLIKGRTARRSRAPWSWALIWATSTRRWATGCDGADHRPHRGVHPGAGHRGWWCGPACGRWWTSRRRRGKSRPGT